MPPKQGNQKWIPYMEEIVLRSCVIFPAIFKWKEKFGNKIKVQTNRNATDVAKEHNNDFKLNR